MIVRSYPFPSAYKEKRYHNKTVIVIDLLRSTTSILEALVNGANQVIPAQDVEEARMFSANWNRKEGILAGERGGLKISGYDVGNSPMEFSREKIKGKNVIICTTNGTSAILDAKTADKIYLGSLRNKTAVARAALNAKNDIILLCAGTMGECSADDVICAGGILGAMEKISDQPLEYNDFSLVCRIMYDAWKNGEMNLSDIKHYTTLSGLGFDEDLIYCFEEDKTDRVPVYRFGAVQLL